MQNRLALQQRLTLLKRRLQKLEEQRAFYGAATPPHILLEIEDVTSEIGKIEALLAQEFTEAVEVAVNALVIDDVARWREQFKDLLEGMGFVVDIVEGMQQAKQLLANQNYTLVLIDIVLEQERFSLSWQQFAKSLRTMYPHIAMVAATGHQFSSTEGFTLAKLGFDEFIVKDQLLLPDFQRRIRDVIDKAANDSKE